MILPYIAIVLLCIVTVYSAIISFREQTDSRASWLSTRPASRSTRIYLALLTLAAVILAVAYLAAGSHKSAERHLRFLIPENYIGWVRVDFEVSGAPPLPVESNQTTVKIAPDGSLRTSSPEPYGWANDTYYFYSGTSLRPIPASGPNQRIWGKINGEATGPAGTRKYEEFFVGTETQVRSQSNAPQQ